MKELLACNSEIRTPTDKQGKRVEINKNKNKQYNGWLLQISIVWSFNWITWKPVQMNGFEWPPRFCIEIVVIFTQQTIIIFFLLKTFG